MARTDINLSEQVMGSLPIANGGTGQTTQQAAMDALAGTQSAGKYLRSDGTHTTLTSIPSGDIPTLNQNTTGSAAKLTTARTINGVSFDGTSNITITDSTKTTKVTQTLTSGSTSYTVVHALGTDVIVQVQDNAGVVVAPDIATTSASGGTTTITFGATTAVNYRAIVIG